MKNFLAVLVMMLSVLLMSCGGGKDCNKCGSPTEPINCTISVSVDSNNFPCTGGSGLVSATTQSGCSFTMTATSDSSWLRITSVGYRDANFVLDSNNTGSRRSGSITAAGVVKVITQDACTSPTCTYKVEPASADYTYQGGNGGFSVSTSAGTCGWTAVSNVGWIEITSGFSGVGNGSVTYKVLGNGIGPTPARTGTITVAGQTFSVSQNAHP